MAIIIAWVPEGTILMNYWPEAEQIEAMHNAGPPKFTDRFPRPDWYKGIGIDTILRADKALEEEK